MKARDYFMSKAVSLCFSVIAVVVWGVFAFLVGANALLLWGSVGFFLLALVLRHTLGYALTNKKLKRIKKLEDGLEEKYLLGEILPSPTDEVQREYFEIMKKVSRSAVGKVESAKKERDDYFGSVEKWIHEIKTPLTACGLICDNGGNIEKLRRELKKADNCTDTILWYARLRSPQNDTAIVETAMSGIIDDAVRSQRELLVAAKIGVETEGDFVTFTDRKVFCFVLKQLLINCAKYCRGCRIRIEARDGKVTVADNGVGIAEHELPRIFDRGFTGKSGKSTGTGMGLYIVRELCKRLSVSVSCTSEEGAGTTFCFKFPQDTGRPDKSVSPA